MKRHLNTSYRLVWNHITGTLVVASELARSRGKRTGVAVAYFHERRSLNNPLCQHSCRLNFLRR
ncbi:AidA-I family adhesin [Escherichia coli]|nr:AidA-I family adhesin [Escherichia coli]